MESTSWLTLLVQVPLVGVFIWYSIQMYRSFMAALDRRDVEYEKRNASLITAIGDLSKMLSLEITRNSQEIARNGQCLGEHDRFVRENIARKNAVPKEKN